jgi:DNA-directed RNA polymerase subunit M/transcription elongation factor TFIIS
VAIRVFCPRCKVRLTVEDDRAGEALDCPNCDLRIRIPAALPPAASPPPPPAQPQPAPTTSAPPTRVVIMPVLIPVERNEDDEERPRRRRRPRCRFCGSRARPYWQRKISTGGWITFALLLVLFWPLCFIGLLIKEDYLACYDCGSHR